MSKVVFSNLNGLRFGAFLFVFLYHSAGYISTSHYPAFINVLLSQGENAVSFFFVLSGFLISYLLIEEKKNHGRIDLKLFYLKRILRIWPIYFILLGLGFLIFPNIGFTDNPNEDVFQFLFLGANFNEIYLLKSELLNSRVLNVLWSIAIEEQFYLFWPIFFYLLSPKKNLYLAILIILFSLLFKWFHQQDDYVLRFHTLSVVSDFCFGYLVAYLIHYKPKAIQYFKALSRIQILLLYSILFVVLYYEKAIPTLKNYRIVLPTLFAILILEQIYAQKSLFKASHFRFIDYLGKISYGLYIYHCVVFVMLISIYEQSHVKQNEIFLFLVASLSITIGVSYLSFISIERFFLGLKSSISFK